MNPKSPFYDAVAESIVKNEIGSLNNIYDLDQFRNNISNGLTTGESAERH